MSVKYRKKRNVRSRRMKKTGMIKAAGFSLLAVVFIFMFIEKIAPNAKTCEEPEETVAADTSGETVEAETGDAAKEDNLLDDLSEQMNMLLVGEDGVWSVYVKDLGTGGIVSINEQPVYAASLIKLFVMQSCYAHMDEIIANDSAYSGDEETSRAKVCELLENMIEVSDNEAYNELVRMHSPNRSFSEGCLVIQDYIEEQGYENTGIYHTLHPSSSESESVSDESNHTSTGDCAALLESIYNGTCVSEAASEEMLDLLMMQQVTTKIPSVLPMDTVCANKTGETDEEQHDAALVMGTETDYIICVMSSELTDTSHAVEVIQELSASAYEYLESGEALSSAAYETEK